MGRFLGITGTPGTGKKTLAPGVAKALGLPCVSLNELGAAVGLIDRGGAVDTARLRRRLLRQTAGGALVYGHLLPDVLARGDLARVVVLRCRPSVLRRRLRVRGYPASKVAANVEAELIGLVSAACVAKFGAGRVTEFDTSSSGVGGSVRSVAAILQGGRSGRVVDWVSLYSSAEKLRSLLSEERTESAFT